LDSVVKVVVSFLQVARALPETTSYTAYKFQHFVSKFDVFVDATVEIFTPLPLWCYLRSWDFHPLRILLLHDDLCE
ncbi:MAG: hypothetical protein VXZ31_03450, partial [Pseudomonadota bacterium]|nr:hypothetical protein [Pseudomonadota bacterium]